MCPCRILEKPVFEYFWYSEGNFEIFWTNFASLYRKPLEWGSFGVFKIHKSSALVGNGTWLFAKLVFFWGYRVILLIFAKYTLKRN